MTPHLVTWMGDLSLVAITGNTIPRWPLRNIIKTAAQGMRRRIACMSEAIIAILPPAWQQIILPNGAQNVGNRPGRLLVAL